MANARTASIVIGGAVRLPVRSYGVAGGEALIELDGHAPGMKDAGFELTDGDRVLAGVVLEERQADGRTTFICRVDVDDVSQRAAAANQ